MHRVTKPWRQLVASSLALALTLGAAAPTVAFAEEGSADEVVVTTDESANEATVELDAQAPSPDRGSQYLPVYKSSSPNAHIDNYKNSDGIGFVLRFWGNGALDTMQAILSAVEVRGDQYDIDTIIVATSEGYWDALAASGLAGVSNGVVVITPKDYLCEQARAEIQRLKPKHCYVVGGPLALSDNVLAQVKELVPDTTRVYGQGADETALRIYQLGCKPEAQSKNGFYARTHGTWGTTAIIATSGGYWDALSASPAAAAKAYPIFLTNSNNRLSNDVLDAIKTGGFTDVVIVGGPLAVPKEVEDQIKGIGITSRRFSGGGALDTSAEIANWEINELNFCFSSSSSFVIATADGYWDALTAGPVCARSSDPRPLLLVMPGDYHALNVRISRGLNYEAWIVGGTKAVPDSVVDWLYQNLKFFD